MDYIISEQRLVKIIDKYITDTVGELQVVDSTNVNAREGDFEIIDENEDLVFEFVDHHLGIKQQLFLNIMNYFNLSNSETEGLFQRWFEYRYPDNLIIAAYCSIYY
jgi:hypothetical protein